MRPALSSQRPGATVLWNVSILRTRPCLGHGTILGAQLSAYNAVPGEASSGAKAWGGLQLTCGRKLGEFAVSPGVLR